MLKEGLYEGASILCTSQGDNVGQAVAFVKLKQFSEAVEAARKVCSIMM